MCVYIYVCIYIYIYINVCSTGSAVDAATSFCYATPSLPTDIIPPRFLRRADLCPTFWFSSRDLGVGHPIL